MSQYRDESLKSAIEAFPLVSYLHQHFERVRDNSDNVTVDCPVCNGRNKLSIHRHKKLGCCFRCADGGHGGSVWNGKCNLVTLICLVERCSVYEAIRTIRSQAGFPETWIQPCRRLAFVDEIFPDGAYDLSTIRDSHPAVRYLERRGMSHLRPYCKLSNEPRYQGRILVTCRYLDEVTAMEARTYTAQVPKSLYDEIFQTSKSVYTSLDFDTTKGFAVLCEGIFDAESVGGNGIALYGSSLKDGQLLKLLDLRKKGIEKLIFAYDGDALKKATNQLLYKAFSFFDCYLTVLPKTEDPNSLGPERMLGYLDRAVQVRDEFDVLPLLF